MINREQAIKIATDFIGSDLQQKDWFVSVKPFVKAIVFYGSTAKETNKPDSDIDILVILPLEKEKEFTEGEYIYDFNGQKVNLVMRSIERLRKISEDKNDLFQKEIFRKSEILSDEYGEVTNLISEINKDWK